MPDLERLLSANAQVLKPSLIRKLTGLVNQPDVISFAAGSPNAETYPVDQLTEIYQDLVGSLGGKLFQYSVTRGDPALIEAVRERASFEATPEETMLASGSQQALDLVARVLLDPGDAVFVEAPSFPGAIGAFSNYRARLFGVRTDDEGMDLDHLRWQIDEAQADGAALKFVYVIPNFQNPSGRVWSPERRRELLELCRREDLLIVEDDAYGEVFFSGVNPETLQPIRAFDNGSSVLYLSTFSKTLAGGLRVAWLHGPEALVRAMGLAKETADLCTSTLSQKLILEFLRRGWMPAQLDRVRTFYEAKAGLLQSSLEKHLNSAAEWTPPQGGLFAWLRLAEGLDSLEIFERSIEEDRVAFIPGKPFFADGSGANCLRLSFSNVADHNIESGLERLGRRIRALS